MKTETNAEFDTKTSTSSDLNLNSQIIVQYGWVCPKCGRVNAPWKDHCDCNESTIPFNTPCQPGIQPGIPYGPSWYDRFKWGDQPGWWMQGPTCINYCAHTPRNN